MEMQIFRKELRFVDVPAEMLLLNTETWIGSLRDICSFYIREKFEAIVERT